MTDEISLEEFRRDIRRQREKRKIRKPVKEPEKEAWREHSDALSKDEYDTVTKYGRKRLRRPRPVWLPEKKKWTVGAPVDPIAWQILIRSEPTKKSVTRKDVENAIYWVCGHSRINDYTFSKRVSQLQDRHLLKYNGGFRHSRIVDKWLHPSLTGLRAGGKWHRNAIHDFVDWVNRELGCYSYIDRGFYPGTEMPDVVVVKPKLIKHTIDYSEYREPLKWNMENSIYAEFKSSVDMREHFGRLEKQLDQYEGVPLYLDVETRVKEVWDMLEERQRRHANLLELFQKAEKDMVYLCGGGWRKGEIPFEPVLRKIKDAFLATYDYKARLKKTGTDPQGRECHELILYDKLGTRKNVGQVIPNFADDVTEFAELFFDKKHLGQITTLNYIYTPTRKPNEDNKTWKWDKRKTKGSKFRSFPA